MTDILEVPRFFRLRSGRSREVRRRLYRIIVESGAIIIGSPEVIERICREEREED